MKTARIYVFGDSLAYGAWDELGGWCDRIKQKVHRLTIDENSGIKFQVFNLGIGGEHSRALLKRVRNEIDARNRPDWPPIMIIETGTNDTRIDDDGNPWVPIEEYISNMESIINIAKEYTDKIILVGIASAKEVTIKFKNTSLNNDLLIKYDQELSKIAEKYNTPKIDVNSGLMYSIKPVYSKDGIHFNNNGHEIVSKLVWNELSKILDINKE